MQALIEFQHPARRWAAICEAIAAAREPTGPNAGVRKGSYVSMLCRSSPVILRYDSARECSPF
jgi:hypothetical protein